MCHFSLAVIFQDFFLGSLWRIWVCKSWIWKHFFFWHKIYIRRTLCIEMFWENSIETSILSRVRQITSPGWMHETSAQGWCTGKTQRNGRGWRGRWEGGSGWGTHVNPWLIHVNVWQKPLQYCKVISLQLIKINGKKTKKKNKQKRRTLHWGYKLDEST